MQTQNDGIVNQLADLAAKNPPQTEAGHNLLTAAANLEQKFKHALAPENYNMAADMDEQLLNEVGQECYNGYKDDENSRADWLDLHAFWLSLYMQQDSAETSDAERAWGATESMPILTEAANQFQSRTYKTFFPNDTFISAVPMRRTPSDRKVLEQRADRIGKHMSYQLSFVDRNYKKDKDALILGIAVHGSFFTKAYPKELNKAPVNLPFKVGNVRPTDLVINYTCGPIRIEEVRRKTHIIRSSVGEVEDLFAKGFFSDTAKPSYGTGSNVYDTKVDEVNQLSQTRSTIKRDAPVVLGEQHCYLDLDGTGNHIPYIVTFDITSHRVLRVVIGYEADPEGNPIKDYEQVQYFTHYKFMENPDGFYGLGLGHTIGDINSAVNIMLRQIMDAATLANDGNMSGFISERLGIVGDEVRMVLGKLTKIPDQVTDMKNGIMMMQFPGPNEALIKIMEMLDARAQRMSATTEATTGTPSSVSQPTTYLAEIEQAMEMFSSVQMRLADALTDELQKIYRLNQKFLPSIEYFVVNGVPDAITRQDYADDMMVMPIFDPKFATQQQKVARAQAELQATLQNPNSQQRPQVYDEAYKRYLEALEVDDIEGLIPPPPQPQDIDNQEWENMQFMMPQQSRALFDVFPDQNHADHLISLEDFVKTEGHKISSPEQAMAIAMHKQKHEAFFYGQQKGLVPPSRPISANALATRPNNSMDIGQLAGTISPQAPISPAQIFGTSPFGGGTITGVGGNK